MLLSPASRPSGRLFCASQQASGSTARRDNAFNGWVSARLEKGDARFASFRIMCELSLAPTKSLLRRQAAQPSFVGLSESSTRIRERRQARHAIRCSAGNKKARITRASTFLAEEVGFAYLLRKSAPLPRKLGRANSYKRATGAFAIRNSTSTVRILLGVLL